MPEFEATGRTIATSDSVSDSPWSWTTTLDRSLSRT